MKIDLKTRLRTMDATGWNPIGGEALAEIEGLEQQLAAALAACKQKDEALATCEPGDCSTSYVMPPSFDERKVEEALAIQPDDSALKAWLGEPAAWVWERRYSNGGYSREVCQFESKALELAEDGKNLPIPDTVAPLYSPKGLK